VAKLVNAEALEASLGGCPLRVRIPPTVFELLPANEIMPKSKRESSKKKRGPKPETLKIEGDWKTAVGNALRKGKPPKTVDHKK
jgi:hypothetical protein